MVCPNCLIDKSVDEFYVFKSGYKKCCITCQKSLSKKYYYSPRGFLKHSYGMIKRRIRTQPTYKTRKLLFLFEELYDFTVKDKVFFALLKRYIKSNFNRKLTPTIDRVNNNGDYSIDNIQFLTLSDNVKKDFHNSYHKSTRPRKSAKLLCIELNKVFPNVSDATKEFSLYRTSIYNACKTNQRLRGYHFKLLR